MSVHEARMGNSIAALVLEVGRYCEEYQAVYHEPVVRDGVLADGVLLVLRGLRRMMLGPMGALEYSYVEQLIVDTARSAGFTREQVTDD